MLRWQPLIDSAHMTGFQVRTESTLGRTCFSLRPKGTRQSIFTTVFSGDEAQVRAFLKGYKYGISTQEASIQTRAVPY